MKTFNTNMFESIKISLENAKNKQGGGANYKNILSIAAPANYIVRLLPNIKNPGETFMHYFHHGWPSVATGQYASINSPATWGERCPVSELYFKILRGDDEDEKVRARELLRRKENWLVNVLVINDPKTPENNGTVKVLRFGKQLNKIIESAISGDDAAEFGAKIFDLSESGCNLRIKAEQVTDKPGAPKYPTYTASKFLSPSAIEGMDDQKASEIMEKSFDLQAFVEHKSAEEIKDFIDTNYYNKNGVETVTKSGTPVTLKSPVNLPEEAHADLEPVKNTKVPVKTEIVNDAKVAAILAGLEDLN